MYFNRLIDKYLNAWSKQNRHKPLLLRGARQVGKSSSVRHLAENFQNYVEINFEKKDSLAAKQVFQRSSNPKIICDELAVLYRKKNVALFR
jgi:predicted AAA+ superfamily ATPase